MNQRLTCPLNMICGCLLAIVVLAPISTSMATADTSNSVFAVWPGKAPGETGDIPPETETDRSPVLGLPVIRLTNISAPTLTVFPAPDEFATGTTVIVFPGGGYNIVSWNMEGSEIAAWLNSIGVHAVVLKYRVPRREGRPMHEAPLQDAQRAIRMVRHNAAAWHIGANQVGVLGFSAGGHLVAATSTNHDKTTYVAIDQLDLLSARPDFSILIYPSYVLAPDDDVSHLAPEIRVSRDTPPAILIQSQDDSS